MRLAVDTSALLAIFNAEEAEEAWLDLLVRARSTNRLVICEVVFGELSSSFSSRDQLDGALPRWGSSRSPSAELRHGWRGRRSRPIDDGADRESI